MFVSSVALLTFFLTFSLQQGRAVFGVVGLLEARGRDAHPRFNQARDCRDPL